MENLIIKSREWSAIKQACRKSGFLAMSEGVLTAVTNGNIAVVTIEHEPFEGALGHTWRFPMDAFKGKGDAIFSVDECGNPYVSVEGEKHFASHVSMNLAQYRPRNIRDFKESDKRESIEGTAQFLKIAQAFGFRSYHTLGNGYMHVYETEICPASYRIHLIAACVAGVRR